MNNKDGRCEAETFRCPNCVSYTPNREERKLSKMKMDRRGEMMNVALEGGGRRWWWGLYSAHCIGCRTVGQKVGCWTTCTRKRGGMGKRSEESERQMDESVKEATGN